MKTLALSFVVLAACSTPEDPALLDHAQILAVRSTPAHVAPGERARIDALVGDDTGAVQVVVPDLVDVVGAERAADGWYVTASPEPGSVAARITIAIGGTPYRADKTLVFGDDAANPTMSDVEVDGSPDNVLDATSGTSHQLAASCAGVEPLSYAWYTSIGTLQHYRAAQATLGADVAGDGVILVVVRDAQGGVVWQTMPAQIR